MSNLEEKLEAAMQDNVEIKIEETTLEEEKDNIEEESMKEESSNISEGFDNFLKETNKEVEELEKRKEEVKKNGNILSNIKVDLSSIEIQESSPIDLFNIKRKVLDDKKTMVVTCCQSAYAAYLSGLRNQEIQNIQESDVDLYTSRRKLYMTVWKHIEDTSVGKMDFETWMKNTSFFDLETLFYGIYCMTFPYENKFNFTCQVPDCQKAFQAVINNNTMVEIRGKEAEIFAKIDEVISNITNSSQLVANSHVHTTKRLILDESKIVFDIFIPSVYDYLELAIKNTSEKMLTDFADSISIALFIKSISIPNIELLEATGNLKFMRVPDEQSEYVDIISSLSYNDGEQLNEEISSFTDRYRIKYTIKNLKCPSCGAVTDSVDLDMENLLFRRIRQGRKNQ